MTAKSCPKDALSAFEAPVSNGCRHLLREVGRPHCPSSRVCLRCLCNEKAWQRLRESAGDVWGKATAQKMRSQKSCDLPCGEVLNQNRKNKQRFERKAREPWGARRNFLSIWCLSNCSSSASRAWRRLHFVAGTSWRTLLSATRAWRSFHK